MRISIHKNTKQRKFQKLKHLKNTLYDVPPIIQSLSTEKEIKKSLMHMSTLNKMSTKNLSPFH